MILIYTILAFLAVYVFLKSKRSSTNGKKLPGPRGLPIIGCALEINEQNFLDKLYTYAEEYGDIFGIKLLHQNFICLNSEWMIRKTLASDPYRQYTNERSKTFFAETMLYGSQSVLFHEHALSSVHSGMRKGIIKGLHVYGQEGINEFERNILQELDRLNQKIASFGDNDFDVVALLQRSLTNIISLLLVGEVLSDNDKDVNMFWDYVEGVNYFVTASVNNVLSLLPILRYAPRYRGKYISMCEAKEKLLQRYFNSRKNTTIGETRGLVDHMIELQRKSLEEGKEMIFTDERIKSNLLETVSAGILTTWSVLSSTMLCLVNNQEYQDKVFKELDENIGMDRLPNHSDKTNCPYLEALELEVHRYITVVPFLGARICPKDINLEGYEVPKGTMILANIWYMHHNPKVWGDPWTFRPERFLDANGQLLPRDHIFRKKLFYKRYC